MRGSERRERVKHDVKPTREGGDHSGGPQLDTPTRGGALGEVGQGEVDSLGDAQQAFAGEGLENRSEGGQGRRVEDVKVCLQNQVERSNVHVEVGGVREDPGKELAATRVGGRTR